VGGVLSTSIPPSVAVAPLPAASFAAPEAFWSSPSPSVSGPATCAMPESASVALKLTTTSPPYHPSAFAARSAAAATSGAVLSMLTDAGSVAVLPALSVAVPTTIWSSPSVDTTRPGLQDSMPDTASLHWNVTLTSSLCQPAALASGSSVWPIVGELPSMRTTTCLGASALPAWSTLQNSSSCVPSPSTSTAVPLCCAPPSSR
jgi:hypothetical protein